ncbi:MAG: molybdenum cofactor guanylyltransferase [bacterium]
MTALILAGGKSRRVSSTYKAFIQLGNKSVIERLVSGLWGQFEEIIIVADEVERYADLGLEILIDLMPAKGPLVGLYTGLAAIRSPYSFVVACDMPFLSAGLIELMKKVIRPEDDVLIPRVQERLHPLHAIYSRNCLPVIKAKIGSGNFSMHSILPELKVRYLEEEEIRTICRPEIALFNLNTDQDVEEARRLVLEGDVPLTIRNRKGG